MQQSCIQNCFHWPYRIICIRFTHSVLLNSWHATELDNHRRIAGGAWGCSKLLEKSEIFRLSEILRHVKIPSKTPMLTTSIIYTKKRKCRCSDMVPDLPVFLCLRQQVVRPSVLLPLTSNSRDAISLYLVEWFQWNLSHIFIMWVDIAEKVFKVRGQGLGRDRPN